MSLLEVQAIHVLMGAATQPQAQATTQQTQLAQIKRTAAPKTLQSSRLLMSYLLVAIECMQSATMGQVRRPRSLTHLSVIVIVRQMQQHEQVA
jgi:hypothetical protein